MEGHEERLKRFIEDQGIEAEHMVFETSCHSVGEAANAIGGTPSDLVKSICLIGQKGDLIVAIVRGDHKVSTSRLRKALDIVRPRFATPEEMLDRTGYPMGGIPSFGYEATFLIDPKVMEKDVIYSGGGSDRSLIKVSTKELQRVIHGQMVRVRK